jgi:RNA-directed DNA polymerase
VVRPLQVGWTVHHPPKITFCVRGVVSPILANIYLHEVLDEWFTRQVVPRLVGRAILVRYADDVVIAFAYERDARRVLDVLPKRLAKYGLMLHPEKTRLVNFERPDRRSVTSPDSKGDACVRPGTFDLLGFTHYWGMSRSGHWVVKQKTAADRFRRTLKRIAVWCRQHRHEPVRDQWMVLKQKLAGHFAYFGVTGNCHALISLRFRVIAVWWKWLSRRSQRGRLPWEKMLRLLACYPLPEPRIRSANVA